MTVTTARSTRTYDTHRRDQLYSQERSVVVQHLEVQFLIQQRLHRAMLVAVVSNVIKFKRPVSVSHDV